MQENSKKKRLIWYIFTSFTCFFFYIIEVNACVENLIHLFYKLWPRPPKVRSFLEGSDVSVYSFLQLDSEPPPYHSGFLSAPSAAGRPTGPSRLIWQTAFLPHSRSSRTAKQKVGDSFSSCYFQTNSERSMTVLSNSKWIIRKKYITSP